MINVLIKSGQFFFIIELIRVCPENFSLILRKQWLFVILFRYLYREMWFYSLSNKYLFTIGWHMICFGWSPNFSIFIRYYSASHSEDCLSEACHSGPCPEQSEGAVKNLLFRAQSPFTASRVTQIPEQMYLGWVVTFILRKIDWLLDWTCWS